MEIWQNQLLLAEGSWDEVGKAAESVRAELIRNLVAKRAVVCEKGIEYWSSVPASSTSVGLFYLQRSPVWVAAGLNELYVTGKSPTASVRAFVRDQIEPRLNELKHLGHARGLRPYLIGRYRALSAFWRHAADRTSEQRVAALRQTRDTAAEQIGRLIAASTTALSPAEEVAELAWIVLGGSAPGSAPGGAPGANISTPERALETLQRVLDAQAEPLAPQVPSVAQRWWPLGVVALLGVWKLTGSWRSLVNWAQHSVLDTASAFYNNWIVEPLLKIYRTIRHDATEQVALVAKESLASDTDSLQRMVVDFARDMDPSLSGAELEHLRTRAANGDMTPVMSVYERQLGSPMTSLVTGKLVRTLLIQVQKGKVDLEIALSGIDQMLQSQQLVFGLIAAIPAFGVLWWLTSVLLKQAYRQLYGAEAAKAESERAQVVTSLSNLDAVVQNAPSRLRDLDVGLIYVHVHIIRATLQADTLASQQLLKVLARLVSDARERNTAGVLANLDRAYMRYQLR